jgi:hypothetical protein
MIIDVETEFSSETGFAEWMFFLGGFAGHDGVICMHKVVPRYFVRLGVS